MVNSRRKGGLGPRVPASGRGARESATTGSAGERPRFVAFANFKGANVPNVATTVPNYPCDIVKPRVGKRHAHSVLISQ